MSRVRQVIAQAVRPVVEPLETRRLLTTVTLTASGGDNVFGAYLDPSTNNVDFYVNGSPGYGSPVQSVPKAQLDRVVVVDPDSNGTDESIVVNTPGVSFALDVSGASGTYVSVAKGQVVFDSAQSLQGLSVDPDGAAAMSGASAGLTADSVDVFGRFDHFAGELNTSSLYINDGGTFNDKGGTLDSGGGTLRISNYGTFKIGHAGTLGQLNGTFLNYGHLISDVGAGNTATVVMNFVNDDTSVNLVNGTLRLANSITANGPLWIDGAAGTLSVPAYTSMAAAITLTGGTFKIDNVLQIGGNNKTTAALKVNGGTLNAGFLKVAEASRASFTQTGGTVVSGGTNVGVSGLGATWQMSGGTATLGEIGFGAWSSNGAATLDFTGGTLTASALRAGWGGTATLNISQNASLNVVNTPSPDGSWNGTGQAGLGAWGGTCTVNQAGGSVHIYDLHLAQAYNSTATYNLSDGTLDTLDTYLTKNADWSGDSQSSTFNQTGGTHRTGALYLGEVPHGQATYRMGGGGLYANVLEELGGTDTESKFVQTGGLTTTNQIMINESGGGPSSISIGGGTVNVLWNAYVGLSANGRLDVSGGAFNTAGTLVVSGSGNDGEHPNGHGTVNLSGSGQITSAHTIVGYGSDGAFNQSGGTLSTGYFLVNGPSGTTGTFNRTAGTANYTRFVDVLKPAASGAAVTDEGALYPLNLAATSDVGTNAIASWNVSWGDGSASPAFPGNAQTASHVFGNGDNNYTIRAIASGGGRTYPSRPVDVFVRNVSAAIEDVEDITVAAGTPFDVAATFTDAGKSDTHTATIVWDDGSTDTSSGQSGGISLVENNGAGSVSASHAFWTSGTHSGRLYVSDNDGAISSTLITVNVSYTAPTLGMSVSPEITTVGQAVALTLKADGPNSSRVNTWQVDWGDGTVETFNGPATTSDQRSSRWQHSHAYGTAGTYTIHATAADSKGTRSAGTATLKVSSLAPAAPSGLFADNVTSNSVGLSWVDNSTDETGFRVYCSKNGSAFRLVTLTDLPSHQGPLPVTYTVAGLELGTTYAFRVAAVTDNVESSRSAPAFATTLGATATPLSIDGPDTVVSGTHVRFRAKGGNAEADSPVTYVWSIAMGSKVVASGQGTTFDYVASDVGSYSVNLTAITTGRTSTITKTLVISQPPLALCNIVGPPDVEIGHTSVFSVDPKGLNLGRWALEDSGPVFSWTVQDAAGEIIQRYSGAINGSGGGYVDLSFAAPEVGQYTITVNITPGFGGTPYTAMRQIDAVKGAPDRFSKQFVDFGKNYEFATAVIEDSLGRFVTVGLEPYGRKVDLPTFDDTTYAQQENYTQSRSLLISRSDEDLTPDARFGDNGKLVITSGPSEIFVGPPVVKELADKSILVVAGVFNAVPHNVSFGIRFIKIKPESGIYDQSFGINGQATWRSPEQVGTSLPQDFKQTFRNMQSAVVADDGKIYVIGDALIQLGNSPDHPPIDGYYFSTTRPVSAVLRFNGDGTLDQDYGNGGMQWVAVKTNREVYNEDTDTYYAEVAVDAVVQPDGSLVVAGNTTALNENSPWYSDVFLYKLSPSGVLDTTFGSNGNGVARVDFGLMPGEFHYANYTDGDDYAFSLLQDSKGRFVVAGKQGWPGYFSSLNNSKMIAARFDSSGVLDSTYGNNPSHPGRLYSNFYGNEVAWTGRLTVDDKLVMAGYSSAGGLIARFDASGLPDTSFGNNGRIILDTGFQASWHASIIASDGDIVVAGGALRDGQDGFGLAKYRPGDANALDLVATARLDGDVDLTWVDAGADEDGFVILRSTSPNGLTPSAIVGSTAKNVNLWVDTTALPNTRYYYKVVAFDTFEGRRRLRGETNIATAVTVAENTDFVLSETVAVPVTGAVVQSLHDLVAGQAYRISVRGYFDISKDGNPATRKHADAEWGMYNPLPQSHGPLGRHLKYGVGINDEELGLNRFPYWGTPASDAEHTYTIAYTPERDGKINLNFHDDYYPDNQPGYMMLVDIYRSLPSAPGDLNATPDRANGRFDLNWRNVAKDYDRVVLERRIDNGEYEELVSLPEGASTYTDEDVRLDHKYSYRLRTFTAFGHSGYSNEAFGVLANARPTVEPIDQVTLRVGDPVSIQVVGNDPDGPSGQLTYLLSGAPVGATVDAQGLIAGWTPSATDVGDSMVWKLTVTDVDGGSTETYFGVNVLPASATVPYAVTPAHVVSQTPTTATLEVQGADDGPASALGFKWRVTQRPYNTPMPVFSETSANGVGHAQVTFRAAGAYEFEVRITDGTDYYGTSRVTVNVAQVLNGVEITEPLYEAEQGETHDFEPLAKDQFGRAWDFPAAVQPSYAWALTSSPTYGTVNSVTGQYTAPATTPTDIAETLQVTATLGDQTRTALAQVKVSATPNEPPVMDELSPDVPNINAQVISLSQFRLWASATDPDGPTSELTYTWSVLSQPANSPAVRFSRNGTNAAAETFATVSADYPMNYSFRVDVADKRGGKTWATIDLTGDGKLTKVLMTPTDAMVGVGKSVRYQASARDGVNRRMLPVPSFQWSVDGVAVAGATSDVFDYVAPTAAGEHVVSVTATAGSITKTTQGNLKVLAPTPPVLQITSPERPADATAPVLVDHDMPIELVVDDLDDDPVEWHLWLRDAEGRRSLVAGGTNELGQAPGTGALAYTIKPTMLRNGVYTVELTDSASSSAPVLDSRSVEIRTQFKLGGLRLPFVDGQIDVPGGTSLTATRVYDSTAADVTGDFGFGWSLQMNDDTFRSTAHGGTYSDNGVPALRTGDLVYLTTPDGQQHAFAFVPKKNSNGQGTIGGVISYSPRFVAVDGSRSELGVNQTGTIFGIPGQSIELRQNPSTGEWHYSTGSGDIGPGGGYNPRKTMFGNAFVLKADDGTVYNYDGSGNLRTSVELNGSAVDYTVGGRAGGRQFAVRRDNKGRITGLSDVPGFTFDGTPDPSSYVEYTYDDAGDLWKIRDRTSSVTTFAYEKIGGKSTHRLISITDARGVSVVNATYSPDDHTLTKLSDSTGAGASVVNAPLNGGQTSQTTKDAVGNGTELIYNDYGDVIRQIQEVRDPSGKLTGYQVTVNDYGYGQSTQSSWDQADRYGVTNINKRFYEKHFEPFTITDADTTGLRYTQSPSTLASEIFYKVIDGGDNYPELDPALFQPASQSARDANGRMRTTRYLKYFAPGKPSIVQDAYGQLTWMMYDSRGNLTHTINALGEGTETEYDSQGRVIATYRATGTGGNALTLPQVTRGGRLSSLTYYASTDPETDKVSGKLKSTIDTAGVTTRYTYYNDGKSKAVFREWVDADGVSHSVRDSLSEYDSAGRPSRTYDAHGNFNETHYDALGLTSYTVDSFGGKTAMSYDARGQLIRTVYPDGTETRTAYDVLGRAEWTSDRFYSGATIDAAGRPTAATDVPSLVTRTVYDSLGRAIGTERYKDASITIISGGSLPESNGPSATRLLSQNKRLSATSTAYDTQGRVSESRDASGSVTRFEYAIGGPSSITTAFGTPNAATALNDSGLTDNLPAGAVSYDTVTDGNGHTTRTYKDAVGRTVRTQYADGSYADAAYGPFGATTRTYDPRKATDVGTPTFTERQYDLAGRLTDLWLAAVTDADPSSSTFNQSVRPHWHYDYDVAGRETSRTDPKGRVTTFGYDDFGNRTSRTMPPDGDGNPANDTERWTYDGRGRSATHVDFKGQTTRYVYDDTPAAGGRLAEEQRFTGGVDSTPDEKTVYHYDAIGRRDTVTEYASGDMATAARTTTTSYDPVTGGVTQVASPEGTLNHAYDPSTGRLTRTWTDSTDTSYRYDGQGRLWKVTVAKLNGQTLATPRMTSYAYDAVGNLLSTTEDGGTPTDASDDLITTDTYDTLNRLDTLVAKRGNGVLFDQDYDYESDGQKDKVTEHRYAGGSIVMTVYDWSYDGLGRLTGEAYTNSGDAAKNYAATYAFDLAGNRVSKTQTGANLATTTSVYNDRDELKTSTTNGVTTASTYDANGNTITDGTHAFTWDLRDRMASVTTNGVTTVYAYDNDGIRVSKKTVADPTRTFVIDGSNPTGYAKPIEEKVNGVVDASYAIGLTVLGQSNPTTGYLSLIQDGQGKTRSVLNVSGVDVQPSDYDAYGNTLQPGQTMTPWQNPDGYTDFESGLTQQNARSFDRQMGMAESADPTIFGVGQWRDANLYSYVGASPISYTDPSGRMSLAGTLAVGGMLIGLGVGFGMTVIMAGHSAYQNIWGVGKGQGWWRNFKNDSDAVLSSLPYFLVDNGIPSSPESILRNHEWDIEAAAHAQRIPQKILATVLLTEMRHYNVLDTIGDNIDRSSGIAQINASTILGHAALRPDLYPAGITKSQAYQMLMDPQSAIKLLAAEIRFTAENARPAINFNRWYEGDKSVRERMVKGFVSAKDTDDYWMVTPFGEIWGMESYEIINKMGRFNEGPW